MHNDFTPIVKFAAEHPLRFGELYDVIRRGATEYYRVMVIKRSENMPDQYLGITCKSDNDITTESFVHYILWREAMIRPAGIHPCGITEMILFMEKAREYDDIPY